MRKESLSDVRTFLRKAGTVAYPAPTLTNRLVKKLWLLASMSVHPSNGLKQLTTIAYTCTQLKPTMVGIKPAAACFFFLATVLSDSNTNVNSMINRRVSLFYRYPLEVSHHMVCPCTLYGVCVVCPGTSALVGQHPPPISISASENWD